MKTNDRRKKARSLRVETLENRLLLSADPVITEFLASNNNTLLDGNGQSSDWIEIYNKGDATIDLNDGVSPWFLTDDAGTLNKWAFPDLPQSAIAPGEFLVVFASGTGVPDPEGNLHTNFSLSAAGEYVGLVRPDLTVASQFDLDGTNYPPQESDISYGFRGTPSTPTDDSILYIDADEEAGGNTSGLSGSGWVPRGLGAGEGSNNLGNEGGLLQSQGSVGELATSISGLDPDLAYDLYAFFWDDDASGFWNLEAGLSSGSLTKFDPSTPGVFEVNATTQSPGSLLLVSGLNILGQGSDDFSDYTDNNRRLYVAPVGQVTGVATATVYIDHTSSLTFQNERSWYDGIGVRALGDTAAVNANSDADYLIPTNNNLGLSWTSNGFDAAANGFTPGKAAIGYESDNTPDNSTSYAAEILTPVPVGTGSVYLRTLFDIEDAANVSDLVLSLQYDDGFVAYINGTEVVSRNAPGTLDHTSRATQSNDDENALDFEDFPLSVFIDQLVDGQNVLAIHALNTGSGSTDFLMVPRLVVSDGVFAFTTTGYLPTPTPGKLNGSTFQGFVGDTTFSVDRGFYTAPISVAIATPTTPNADIYYTTDGSVPTPTNPSATLYTSEVAISTTTNLRAAGYIDGFAPSNVDTQTYVFIEDVLVQDPLNVNGNGVSPANGLLYPTVWQGSSNNTADYEIDPRIVNSAAHDDSAGLNTDIGIREALQALPTISLTLEHDALWAPLGSSQVGIGTDATLRGTSFRHPGSFEYFDPRTGESFQYNVGIQAHGNASRDNVRLKKHSFRLIFNSDFDGPGTLDIPIFRNSDNDDINTVVLRASFTDALATRTSTNRYTPLLATHARDVFLRDTQRDMGSYAPASTYAHLYINGLYWGLYNPSERIDDASLAANLGGEREDWDIIRGFGGETYRGNSDAWNELLATSATISNAAATTADVLYQQIQGRFADGTNDPNTPALLDATSLIDSMLLHLYSGVEDWPKGNWYAVRNRVDPGAGFQFPLWDQEISLDQLFRDRTDNVGDNGTMGRLYLNLRNSSEFRLDFADRIQKHLFNDGAMTTAANQARWTEWTDLIEPGIVGESARWGDAREGEVVTSFTSSGPGGTTPQIPTGSAVVPALTVDDWRASVDWVHNEYFTKATDILVSRLLNDGLYNSVDAPQFTVNGVTQFGGQVLGGSSLGINGTGTVYFTTDGADPRAVGGGVAGTQFNSPLTIDATTVVNARSFSGGVWSPLSQTTFVVDNGALVISEVNFNPHAPATPAELAIAGIDNNDFEFIEIYNRNPLQSINLLGANLVGEVTFTFGNVLLGPNERIVVVEDLEAFEARYGTGVNVAGEWGGKLSNSGAEIQLRDALGADLHRIDYDDSDPWAVSADGAGATFVLKDELGVPAELLSKYYSYRGSTEFGGTPGEASAPTVPQDRVVINEVLAHTDTLQSDTIELYNPTDQDIDIGGWFLSDAGASLQKFQIPLGTTLLAGQYITYDESDFNPTPQSQASNHFALKSTGDDLFLTRPDGSGGVLFVDQVDFGASFNGESFGRTPNGTGRLAPMVATTFGAANSAPRIAGVIISELNFHPADPSQEVQDLDPLVNVLDNDLEYIEILNTTGSTIDLTNWRLRGDVDFDFADSVATSIGIGERLVVVPFNPATNPSLEAAFRKQYGDGTNDLPASVKLVGGFQDGQNLNNSYGRVTLQQPDATNPLDIQYVTADEVLYDDLGPWPTVSHLIDGGLPVDGGGATLERVGPTLYGNAASSWLAAAPTPGEGTFVPELAGDYDRNRLVDHNDYLVWRSSYGNSLAQNADGNGDGSVDAVDYVVWRNNLGASLPQQASSASPATAVPTSSSVAGPAEPMHDVAASDGSTLPSNNEAATPLLFVQSDPGAINRIASRSLVYTSSPAQVNEADSTEELLLARETAFMNNAWTSNQDAPLARGPAPDVDSTTGDPETLSSSTAIEDAFASDEFL